MTAPFRVALVQMTAGNELAANIPMAEALIDEAAKGGADLICTPEVTSLMERRVKSSLAQCVAEEDDPALKAFRAKAESLGKWLAIGSLPIKIADDRLANRSFVIAPSGEIAARYDKIHMFDVNLPDGETIRESKAYQPGTKAVLADLPWGRMGLSICYDLRFAGLYRHLAQAGASFLSVPAAFTRITGEAHWHVLLRARAIETGCYVFAAAQCGDHADGRKTFGHALVVAPWGEVLADGGSEPGVCFADIDPARVGEARERIPALSHDRRFEGPGA